MNIIKLSTAFLIFLLSSRYGSLEHEKRFLLEDSASTVWRIALYKDSLLITSSNDIIQKDIETGSIQRTFRSHTNMVRTFIVLNDSRIIRTGNDDHIIIWDLETGSVLKRIWLRATNTLVRSISYQNGIIFAGGADNHLRQIDSLTGRILKTIEMGVSVEAVAVSGEFLFVGKASFTASLQKILIQTSNWSKLTTIATRLWLVLSSIQALNPSGGWEHSSEHEMSEAPTKEGLLELLKRKRLRKETSDFKNGVTAFDEWMKFTKEDCKDVAGVTNGIMLYNYLHPNQGSLQATVSNTNWHEGNTDWTFDFDQLPEMSEAQTVEKLVAFLNDLDPIPRSLIKQLTRKPETTMHKFMQRSESQWKEIAGVTNGIDIFNYIHPKQGSLQPTVSSTNWGSGNTDWSFDFVTLQQLFTWDFLPSISTISSTSSCKLSKEESVSTQLCCQKTSVPSSPGASESIDAFHTLREHSTAGIKGARSLRKRRS
ncbi:hypothetical protein MP638_004037 [Amoeboaphelidium occidentale]|nr:hypothetical protein MP638_004037 [Amoeboaphelidium occidentale]